MSKTETLVIKYSGPKEQIDAIREASVKFTGNVETFFHYGVTKYFEEFWWPQRMQVPTNLFK